MPKPDSYFMYFPGNYRWSAAFINMLGCAPYGGSDIGELHKIGRLLQGKGAEDDEAWFDACVKVADGVRAHADTFAGSGHRVSAAHAYLRACNYYQMAERFRTPKDDKGLAVYRTAVQCFHRHANLTDVKIEIVEVPFEGGSFPGYFVHAQNARSKRTPCVVFFDGLDVTKEIQFTRGVPDLIKRGISVLIMDGPGTGEAIRFRGHYLRHDYEVAGSACIDYLETREDVDPKKIGVVAISLGGYYAPRCASMEPRFAACIAWGAIWDYYATWQRRIKRLKEASLPVPADHLLWVTGTTTFEEALTKLEGFRLDGVAQKVTCPFLLTHGTDDEQVPMADAQKLFDAIGSKDKTFRVFDPEEGGAQHCQRDYLTLVSTTIADWLAERLGART
jgi:alpha-beta hydrolase superfamily lysophospholipase